MNNVIAAILQDVPIRNPVYLMVGAPLGISAKGTGIKAIQFALSVCGQVDIYGFTVDPGHLEWYALLPSSTHPPANSRQLGKDTLHGTSYRIACDSIKEIHWNGFSGRLYSDSLSLSVAMPVRVLSLSSRFPVGMHNAGPDIFQKPERGMLLSKEGLTTGPWSA